VPKTTAMRAHAREKILAPYFEINKSRVYNKYIKGELNPWQ
jgi:hypothetical protein